jgi:uncharacterized membrane protein
MMRDEDKPFICYRQSKYLFQITPRNAAGWRALGLWMLPFLAATGLFVAMTMQMEQRGISESTVFFAMVLPFMIATAVWSIAMIRWMKDRSQIIDANAVAKVQQEQERQAKKRGRM